MDLLNTHLESTAEHADERMRQLEKCFDIMTKRPEDRTVILGGDLNMRDKEVTGVGGLPAGARDVWEQLGSRPEVSNRSLSDTFFYKFSSAQMDLGPDKEL